MSTAPLTPSLIGWDEEAERRRLMQSPQMQIGAIQKLQQSPAPPERLIQSAPPPQDPNVMNAQDRLSRLQQSGASLPQHGAGGKILDFLASGYPQIGQAIPGTTLNYQKRLQQAEGDVNQAQEQNQRMLQGLKTQADIADVNSQVGLREAQEEERKAKAAQEQNAPPAKPTKVGEMKAYTVPGSTTPVMAYETADGQLIGRDGNALPMGALPYKETAEKQEEPKSGVVKGRPTFAIQTPQGWVSADGKKTPLPEFQPAPNYAQIIPAVTGERQMTDTKEVIGPDGLVHIMGYNPRTQQFDRDQGLSGAGQQGSRMSAAGVSEHAGESLINDLQANRDKLGTLGSWVKKYGLNTPIADPTLAGLQAELSSFAALQPAQHGFRSASALETFDKIIGGLQQNPDATIAAIRAINKTAGFVNPNVAPKDFGPAPAGKAEGSTGKIGNTNVVVRNGRIVEQQ